MSEAGGHSPATGERRRRREAARQAALAAEQGGNVALPTRRELRRRAAEEAARLEALATGELRLGPGGEIDTTGGFPSAAPSATSGPRSATAERARAAGSSASVGSAVSASSGELPTVSSRAAGSSASAGSAVSAPSGEFPTVSSGSAASSSRSASSAPAAPESAGSGPAASSSRSASSAPAVPASAASGSVVSASSAGVAAGARPLPSRRSIREKFETAEPIPTAPQERTATGRRPVVRTPTSAQGIRRLDATGQLTGIQPAVRPDDDVPAHPLTGGIQTVSATGEQPVARSAGAAPADRPTDGGATPVGRRTGSGTGTSDPAAWGESITASGEIIALSPATARAAGGPSDGASAPTSPSSSSPSAGSPSASSPTVDSPSAGSPSSSRADSPSVRSPLGAGWDVPTVDRDDDAEEEWPDAPPRPQWVAIGTMSDAEGARRPGPTRRSLRQSAWSAAESEELEPEEDESPNPVATVIKVVVLALVAAIIGALIWLLATEVFDDDTTAAPTQSIMTIDPPKETSAR